jgi:hypothetical protein
LTLDLPSEGPFSSATAVTLLLHQSSPFKHLQTSSSNQYYGLQGQLFLAIKFDH